MTISELKEYIFKNNKIEYILEQLDCHNIVYHSNHDYFSASFPDGDNFQGINIRNNKYLNYRSFSRNVSYDDEKDIIDLVQYITKKNFIDSIKHLHNLLGLQYVYKKVPEKKEDKPDPLWVFKKIQQAKKKVDVSDVHVIEEEALNDFVPMLHIDWLRDGVMPWTREKFGLAYSYKRKRVVIPHRFWMTGELLGMNMRTTVPNYEEFGITKYILSNGMNKQANLYGLYENYNAIQKAGYVVVYESERSVLKRDSLCDATGVALSGKTISEEQIRILISLNVEIIIGLDCDVDINEIRYICERFYRIRPVSYIYDKWNLLGEKDSSADASNKVYQFLFKHRTKYTETEHQLYLKSLEKR